MISESYQNRVHAESGKPGKPGRWIDFRISHWKPEKARESKTKFA